MAFLAPLVEALPAAAEAGGAAAGAGEGAAAAEGGGGMGGILKNMPMGGGGGSGGGMPVPQNEGTDTSQGKEDAISPSISMVKETHIVEHGGGYRLLSHEGKNLGDFDSKEAAEKHEREVQYFKHKGALSAALGGDTFEDPGIVACRYENS